MINSLNPASFPNGVTFQNNVPNAPVSVQNNTIQPVRNPNLNGLNALAGYNQPAAASAPKVIQPLAAVDVSPEKIGDLKGDRITNSDGKLTSVIDNDGTQIVEYRMNPDFEQPVVDTVRYYDKASGKLVKIQENHLKSKDSPETETTFVTEIDPNTGKDTKHTYYDKNGEWGVVEFNRAADGSSTIYSVNSDGTSRVTEENPDGLRLKTISFDKSRQIEEVRMFNENGMESQIIKYKNGIPVKIETPNASFTQEAAQIPSNDSRIVPAQPFIMGYDPKTVQGEKKYYSNGQLESIETKTTEGSVWHTFDVGGNLESVISPDKKIEFNGINNTYEVIEKLDNENTKSTTFMQNGEIYVYIENQNTKDHTSACYSKEGRLNHYCTYDKAKDKYLSISFDKYGNVCGVC